MMQDYRNGSAFNSGYSSNQGNPSTVYNTAQAPTGGFSPGSYGSGLGGSSRPVAPPMGVPVRPSYWGGLRTQRQERMRQFNSQFEQARQPFMPNFGGGR